MEWAADKNHSEEHGQGVPGLPGPDVRGPDGAPELHRPESRPRECNGVTASLQRPGRNRVPVEIDDDKAPDDIRYAAFGSSMTWGASLEDRETEAYVKLL